MFRRLETAFLSPNRSSDPLTSPDMGYGNKLLISVGAGPGQMTFHTAGGTGLEGNVHPWEKFLVTVWEVS